MAYLSTGDPHDPVIHDAKATATVFAGIIALVMAAAYCITRIGFPQYPVLTVYVLALGLLLVSLPTTYLLLAPHIGLVPGSSWLTTDVAIGVGGGILVALSGYLPPSVQRVLLPLFVLSGFLCFAFVLVVWLKSGNGRQNMLFLVLSALFAVWMTFRWMAVGYQNPLFEEQMLVLGGNKDTLFHASISSMIQTYGVPSTGLDGIPYFHYHTGSHWLFAQLASLLGTYPLRVYQLAFPVICYPLFFASMLSFALDFRSTITREPTRWKMRTDVIFWAIVLVPHIGLFPLKLRRDAAIFDSYLVSESFLLCLTALFAGFSLCLSFFKTVHHRLDHLAKGDVLFLVLFLPCFLSILGFFKVSVMVLVFVVCLYLFFKFALFRYWLFDLSLLLTFYAFGATYSAATGTYEGGVPVLPFAFIRSYVSIPFMPFFFALYFFLSWTFIIWRLSTQRIRTVRELKEAWKNQTILDSEVLAIFCAVGIAPGMILAIPGGSAGYFSDVQRWVAASFLLAFSGILTQNWALTKTITIPRAIGMIQLKHVLAIAVSSMFVVSFLFDTTTPITTALRAHVVLRLKVLNIESAEVKAAIGRRDTKYLWSLATAPYQAALEKRESYQLVQVLQELQTLPLAEKQETLLFIPKSSRIYWGLPNRACYSVPFIAPALTGLAMINGLPDADCEARYYGYAIYPHPNDEQPLSGEDHTTLCSHARAKGFSRIIILDSKNGAMTKERIPCN